MKALISTLSAAPPPEVRTISRVLAEAGEKSWIVGGCVRDILLDLHGTGRTVMASDWDLATTAPPEKVKRLFRQVIPTGLEHGTVTVVLSKQHFEVTTLRGEKGHSDGRRPDEVYFVSDLNEDLARRDFTVNAMAFDLENNTFHDPYNGQGDLEHGLLRAVGEASARFAEDGLRVLRCARFTATLGFEIESETARAIRPSLASFRKVAQERVRDEWFKALSSQEPSRFLSAIRKHEMLSVTAPFLFPAGTEPVIAFQLALPLIDRAPSDPLLRVALLTVAGARSNDEADRRGTDANAAAKELGKRLRLSSEQFRRLTLLVGNHRLPESLLRTKDRPTTRRYLSKITRERAEDLLSFQECLDLDPSESADEVRTVMRSEASSSCPLSLKELAVSGKDLLEAGVPKGPQLGTLLARLLDLVLDEPERNERDELLLALAAFRAADEHDSSSIEPKG